MQLQEDWTDGDGTSQQMQCETTSTVHVPTPRKHQQSPEVQEPGCMAHSQWTWKAELEKHHLTICNAALRRIRHVMRLPVLTESLRLKLIQVRVYSIVMFATCQLRYMYRGKNDWQLNNFGIFLSSLLYTIHVPFHIHHLAYCKFTLFTYPFIVITHLSNL